MKQNEGNLLLVLLGPRPNRGNKTKNGRQVNKVKIHRITIRSVPCGKLGSTKWRSQKLEVDNNYNVRLMLGNAFSFEFSGFWKKNTGTRTNTAKLSLSFIRI